MQHHEAQKTSHQAEDEEDGHVCGEVGRKLVEDEAQEGEDVDWISA